MHIKEPLLLIEKSCPCGGSGFSLSLSEWSFTICPTPYNRKLNVLSASLNKTFPSLLPDPNRLWVFFLQTHFCVPTPYNRKIKCDECVVK